MSWLTENLQWGPLKWYILRRLRGNKVHISNALVDAEFAAMVKLGYAESTALKAAEAAQAAILRLLD